MEYNALGQAVPNPKGGPKEGLANTPWTNKQIAEGLRASHGVFADTAKYLTRKYARRISRGLIADRVKKHRELSKLCERIRESALDYVEKRMWNRIEMNDPRMIAYYLNTFGKERGYGAKREATLEADFKIEITGSDANL